MTLRDTRHGEVAIGFVLRRGGVGAFVWSWRRRLAILFSVGAVGCGEEQEVLETRRSSNLRAVRRPDSGVCQRDDLGAHGFHVRVLSASYLPSP